MSRVPVETVVNALVAQKRAQLLLNGAPTRRTPGREHHKITNRNFGSDHRQQPMPLHKEGYENVGVVGALTGERVQLLYVFQTHSGGVARQVDRWDQKEISTGDSPAADRICVDASRQSLHHGQGQNSARAEAAYFGIREKIVVPAVGSWVRDNDVKPFPEDSFSAGEELVWLRTDEVWETCY